jgi:hypothetical protein
LLLSYGASFIPETHRAVWATEGKRASLPEAGLPTAQADARELAGAERNQDDRQQREASETGRSDVFRPLWAAERTCYGPASIGST